MSSFIFSIIPGIVWFIVLYIVDDVDFKNSKRVMPILFILGCLGSYVCYRIEWHVGSYFPEVKDSNYFEVFIYALFGVGIFEEGWKWIISLIFILHNKIKSGLNIVLYTTVVSCGFMIFENYVFYGLTWGLDVLISRMFTSIPMHICCGVIMGDLIYKFINNKKYIYLVLSFIVPSVFHAFYNTWLYKGEIGYYKITYLFLIILVFISIVKCVILIEKEEDYYDERVE